MKPQNLLRITLELALIPLGTYIGAAVLLGHIPANADWRAPGAPESGTVTIFVQTNGLHTGIVVPTVANGIDWRNRIRSSDLPHPGGMGRWLAFGWGDRAFYIDTPTWRQVRLLTIVRALTGTGPTVLHVDHLDSFTADASWRPLKLRRAEYRRLTAFVAATFATGHDVTPGYTSRDVFYAGRGHYSALRTCNVWTGDALRTAGVRVGVWTPFASDVMRWVPAP